jgi:ATP-dependent helicase/nuclease subunit A
VDLNMNFRSKTPIIDAVNGVFSVLMGENAFEGAGGAADGPAYDDAAALRLGLAYDSAWDAPPKLMVIDMAAESEGGGVAATDVFEGEASASAEVMAGAGNEEAFAGFGAGEEDAFAESGAAARIDEEILSLKDVEREALAAAAVIREARGEMFFDAKAGVLRPLDYGDMVVLLREARTSGPVFTETLLAAGVDAYAESGDGYLGTVEIETFLHLLRVIDNARQDIPLVSALYSPVFGFTVNELAEIRMTAGERGGPFYKAFLACAAEADGPGHDAGDCARARAELAAKCAAAAGRIAEWRREESFMELSDFLWLVLKESGWYDYAGALAGGALRQANLLAMTVRAAEYGSGRARGLFGFIRYIESVEDKKLPVPQAKLVTEGENVIRVMTIHKSKGLEYPLVIVAGLGKRLMTAGRGDRLALHREFGLALTREDPESYTWRKTLLMNAVLGRASEEERAELLRVLYVAMTRAQDRLVLIGSRKGAGRATDPKQGATFLDMLLPLAHDAGMELSVATPADLARTISGSEAEKSRAEEKLAEVSNGPEDDSLYAEIDRRLSFVYPHESAVRLKSKYSVSELNKRSVRRQALFYIEESEAAAVEDEGRTAVAAEDDESAAVVDRDVAPDAGDTEAAGARRSAAAAAERGVALHKALEKLDFAEARAHCSGMASATDSRYPAGTSNQHRPGDEKFALAEEKGGGAWFDAYLDGLVNGGFLTQQQRASVNADDLMRFASSDICARAAASPRARRETPFNYRMMREGERVIVQGVIDLFFEEGNDLVLVDFKSGGAHAGPDEQARRAAETYGEQIRLYRAALEEITGKRVKESLLYLTSYGRTVVIPRQDRRGE